MNHSFPKLEGALNTINPLVLQMRKQIQRGGGRGCIRAIWGDGRRASTRPNRKSKFQGLRQSFQAPPTPRPKPGMASHSSFLPPSHESHSRKSPELLRWSSRPRSDKPPARARWWPPLGAHSRASIGQRWPSTPVRVFCND